MSGYTTPPLSEVTGKNTFCGPAALSSILGVTTDEVAALARERFGYDRITGMWLVEIKKILNAYGHDMVTCCRNAEDHYPTIGQWRRFAADRKATYLIGVLIGEPVVEHVVVVRGSLIVDNHLMVPTPLGKTKHRHLPVVDIDKVVKRGF